MDPNKFDFEVRWNALPPETKASAFCLPPRPHLWDLQARLEELRALQEELLASVGISAAVQTILVNSRDETKRKEGEASTTVSYCGSSGSETDGEW